MADEAKGGGLSFKPMDQFEVKPLFGTTPWLMIIFVFLGLAAGIQTMMRSAKEVQSMREAEEANENDAPRG